MSQEGPPPIEVYNRHTGGVEVEPVYGERWLRLLYGGNALGNLLSRALASRAWFSRWYGWRMRQPSSRKLIRPFLKRYRLEESEFAEPASAYPTFNDFFIRRLRPEARPLDADPAALLFAADGRHQGWSEWAPERLPPVKGAVFTVAELLADGPLAERFRGGPLIISRLCPLDYHRFHFPASGRAGEPKAVAGPLYSVNPWALARRPRTLAQNRRDVTLLETGRAGMLALVEIGATCVGSLVQTFTAEAPDADGGRPVERGREKGYFQFGGSSLVVLGEPGRWRLAEDLLRQTAAGRELYARMGSRAGTAT